MTALAMATRSVLRDRDLFVHDGTKLRRLRLSAPVQALFLVLLFVLVGFSGFSAARLVGGKSAPTALSLDQATELRARVIEQRQAVLAAMLSGEAVDPQLVAALTTAGRGANEGPLARVEDAQFAQAALVARALDQRYEVTATELKRLGLNPSKVAAVGGPFETASSGDATFKQLFTSWKKLDNLQDGAIAVPSDKPVRTADFTSGYGVRSDPFKGRAAMHAGIDLAGPTGTPIYATADGTVLRAGYNSGGYGNLIELDHGKGIATRYGHLSAIGVSAGQRVTRGQLIGRMGSTGRSTGSHLHYEVRIDGRAVNPIPFMKSTDYLVAMQHKGATTHSMDAVALGGPQR